MKTISIATRNTDPEWGHGHQVPFAYFVFEGDAVHACATQHNRNTNEVCFVHLYESYSEYEQAMEAEQQKGINLKNIEEKKNVALSKLTEEEKQLLGLK